MNRLLRYCWAGACGILCVGQNAASTNQWVLDYATFLGGHDLGYSEQAGFAITTDARGNIIVAGYTDQPSSFSITQWFGDPNAICGAFITRLDPAGLRVLSSSFVAWAQARSL